MLNVAFTGDLGFSSKYFRGTENKKDLLHSSLVEYLKDTDYTVVNVEGCVYEGKASADKPLVHANPPSCVDFLKSIHGNIWNLSNNHIMDCGRAGLESTLAIAAENGVKTLGVGLNKTDAARPAILEKDGVSVGIFSVTQEETPAAGEASEGAIRWNDEKTISQIIGTIKERCRWCVVVVHAGPEFCQLTPPSVRKLYRSYLRLGADVVVGHHPHVVQNYETFGEKIIFYSLGNFVFDTDYQRLQKYTEYGVFLRLSFEKDCLSWDHRAMKIDRETQSIVPCETPAVFSSVSALQYALLCPLAMRDLYRNEWVKFQYLRPQMKGCSAKEWAKFYEERIQKNPRWRCIRTGHRLYWLNTWQLGKRSVRKYIEESLHRDL